MFTWLTRPLLTWIVVGLGVFGIVCAIYAAGANSMKPQVRDLRAQVANLTRDRIALKDAYARVVKLRADEVMQSNLALAQARQACDADIQAIRAAEAAKRRMILKPVRFDAKLCPIRELVAAKDLGLKP
jgi:hypothetical protein